MDLNNISNYFKIKIIDNLYDTLNQNFEFCKIHIHHNNIHKLSTIEDLFKFFSL
jgi:hypothetical protein